MSQVNKSEICPFAAIVFVWLSACGCLRVVVCVWLSACGSLRVVVCVWLDVILPH